MYVLLTVFLLDHGRLLRGNRPRGAFLLAEPRSRAVNWCLTAYVCTWPRRRLPSSTSKSKRRVQTTIQYIRLQTNFATRGPYEPKNIPYFRSTVFSLKATVILHIGTTFFFFYVTAAIVW